MYIGVITYCIVRFFGTVALYLQFNIPRLNDLFLPKANRSVIHLRPNTSVELAIRKDIK